VLLRGQRHRFTGDPVRVGDVSRQCGLSAKIANLSRALIGAPRFAAGGAGAANLLRAASGGIGVDKPGNLPRFPVTRLGAPTFFEGKGKIELSGSPGALDTPEAAFGRPRPPISA